MECIHKLNISLTAKFFSVTQANVNIEVINNNQKKNNNEMCREIKLLGTPHITCDENKCFTQKYVTKMCHTEMFHKKCVAQKCVSKLLAEVEPRLNCNKP